MFGVPFEVLRGWTGAMTSLVRHFDLRNNISAGIKSVTGYPEGCSLSCIAMIMVDSVLHFWMDSLGGLVRTLTYVDDWQILSQDPRSLERAWDHLQQFASQVDVVLDPSKTSMWSTEKSIRKSLRQGGFAVVQYAKNLGAHVQLSQKRTNRELIARTEQLQNMWESLRSSSSPYHLKVRAIVCAAWPRGLHGVAATSVSFALLTSLRAGAVRGLNADAAGASSILQLSCVEHPLTDPGFWIIMQTLRTVRDCGTPSRVKEMLVEIAYDRTRAPSNSITHTLLSRMQLLGWSISCNGLVSDSIGEFDLFQQSFPEVQFRAERAWLQVVAHEVSHRQGFDAMFMVDACVRICKFCSCEDSRYHRFWQCDHFAHCRQEIDAEVWEAIPQLPEVLTCYGWSTMSPTYTRWLQILDNIPQYDIRHGHILPVGQVTRVFTDGSCFHQHDSVVRYAAWACVACMDGHKVVLAPYSPWRTGA